MNCEFSLSTDLTDNCYSLDADIPYANCSYDLKLNDTTGDEGEILPDELDFEPYGVKKIYNLNVGFSNIILICDYQRQESDPIRLMVVSIPFTKSITGAVMEFEIDTRIWDMTDLTVPNETIYGHEILSFIEVKNLGFSTDMQIRVRMNDGYLVGISSASLGVTYAKYVIGIPTPASGIFSYPMVEDNVFCTGGVYETPVSCDLPDMRCNPTAIYTDMMAQGYDLSAGVVRQTGIFAQYYDEFNFVMYKPHYGHNPCESSYWMEGVNHGSSAGRVGVYWQTANDDNTIMFISGVNGVAVVSNAKLKCPKNLSDMHQYAWEAGGKQWEGTEWSSLLGWQSDLSIPPMYDGSYVYVFSQYGHELNVHDQFTGEILNTHTVRNNSIYEPFDKAGCASCRGGYVLYVLDETKVRQVKALETEQII